MCVCVCVCVYRYDSPSGCQMGNHNKHKENQTPETATSAKFSGKQVCCQFSIQIMFFFLSFLYLTAPRHLVGEKLNSIGRRQQRVYTSVS